MNEMKPEDVMRALECWASGKPCEEDCPILEYEGSHNCSMLTIKNALALLREKDAEIERLTKERDDARSDCAVAEQNHYKCKKELETARYESITEFAERLKGKCDAPHFCVWFSEIEDLEEKMKGELDEN